MAFPECSRIGETWQPTINVIPLNGSYEMQINSKYDFAVTSTSGGIAASFTHLIVVPIDVVKTKIQLDPNIRSSSHAFQAIKNDIGKLRTLSLGVTPTIIGYYLQGVCKYGLYDVFKERTFSPIESNFLKCLVSASCAEAIGDVLLAPFEAIRIHQVSNHKSSFRSAVAIKSIWEGAGFRGFYKGLPPLILKQVPYTASKFVVYESTKQRLLEFEAFKDNQNETARIVTSAIAGGLVSAVVSHPADTLLTCINAQGNQGFSDAIKRMIDRGIWTGIRPRLVMVGGLASLQLIIFEAVRSFLIKQKSLRDEL